MHTQQEYAIDMQVGALAVMAVTMADAWRMKDYVTLDKCAQHAHQLSTATRIEITQAYAEGRLPNQDITEMALRAQRDYIANHHDASQTEDDNL